MQWKRYYGQFRIIDLPNRVRMVCVRKLRELRFRFLSHLHPNPPGFMSQVLI